MSTDMGKLRVPIQVASLAGGRFEAFDALVDTGATYTVVPRERLAALGVSAEEWWPFVLADGRQVSYGIAWVRVRIDGRTQPTIAVFGDPGCEPLLGVVTLEEFRLGVDPVTQRLIPVPGLLKPVEPYRLATPRSSRMTCLNTPGSSSRLTASRISIPASPPLTS